MKYTVCVVPPGGGEQDYQITIRDASFIPRPGEYIIVRERNTDEAGKVSAFKVRYAVTYAQQTHVEGSAREDEVVVEAEPIIHPHQTSSHSQSVEMYRGRGKAVEEFPESGY